MVKQHNEHLVPEVIKGIGNTFIISRGNEKLNAQARLEAIQVYIETTLKTTKR